jgi:hypothetical protein
VAVIHCFSFGQWHTVLSRVAEALWGIVLHCALQLPPLSTASFLQLELEVSVLAKFLAGVDSEFTCAAVLRMLHACPHALSFAPSAGWASSRKFWRLCGRYALPPHRKSRYAVERRRVALSLLPL